MAEPTEIYVDPAIAADSGTGTIGDPFGDLQFALNSVTRDATNGNRFNVKAGTAEVLAAALTLATYGTPTEDAPLVFQGYTSAAGDGGIAEIDLNSFAMFTTTYGHVSVGFCEPHNAGSATILTLGVGGTAFENEIHDTTGNAIYLNGANAKAIRNHIHDVGNIGIFMASTGTCALLNRLENGSVKKFARCVSGTGGGLIEENTIDVDGSTDGIVIDGDGVNCRNNSIYSAGGTGVGISTLAVRGYSILLDNVIEGFSGVGGNGIELHASGKAQLYGGNKVYNCTTNFDVTGKVLVDLGGNASLSASPFVDAAGGDFRPNNVAGGGAELRGAAFGVSGQTDSKDIGAVQHADTPSTTTNIITRKRRVM